MDARDLDVLLPSLPDSATLMRTRCEQMVAPLDAAKTTHNCFNAVSLTAWLTIAAKAGIAHVSAHEVACLSVDMLLNFEEPRLEDAALWMSLQDAIQGTRDGEMLRWDCCAGLALKGAMDDSPQSVSHGEMTDLHPGDPRFFDIAYMFPEVEMRVLRRPWVKARQENGRPVEYRVYVLDGIIVGLSNYYPQRALHLSAQRDAEIREVLRLGSQFVEYLRFEALVPWFKGLPLDTSAEGLINCTLDFLIGSDGEVLFLEAGPPFGAGAHPCCFEYNVVQAQREVARRISVEGVALGLADVPLCLHDFGLEAIALSPSSQSRASAVLRPI